MLRQILIDEFRFLTFRQLSPAVGTHWKQYLAFGMLCTWLAGIGRYWDHPDAYLIQYLGVGSVLYVLCLSALIWLLAYPLRPKNWKYRNILIFVTLTSPPAFLYAVPVERFMPLADAQATNAWFLAVVAAWRVALLLVFLRRVAQLSIASVIVATLFPLTLIVVALSALNLEHVVFSLMAGIAPENTSPHDISFMVVMSLSILSILLAPVLFIAYAILVVRGFTERRASN